MIWRISLRFFILAWGPLTLSLALSADIPCSIALGKLGTALRPLLDAPIQITEKNLSALRTQLKGAQLQPPITLGSAHQRIFRHALVEKSDNQVRLRVVFDQHRFFIYAHQGMLGDSPGELAWVITFPEVVSFRESTVSRITKISRGERNYVTFAVGIGSYILLYDGLTGNHIHTLSIPNSETVLSLELNPSGVIAGTRHQLLWFDLQKPWVQDQGPTTSLELPGPALHIEEGFFEKSRTPAQVEVEVEPDEPWQIAETVLASATQIAFQPTIIVVSNHQLLTYGHPMPHEFIPFTPLELPAPVVAMKAISTVNTREGARTLIFMRTQDPSSHKSKIKIINNTRSLLSPQTPVKIMTVKTFPSSAAFSRFFLFSYVPRTGEPFDSSPPPDSPSSPQMALAVTNYTLTEGFLFTLNPQGRIGLPLAPEDIVSIDAIFPIKALHP